MAQIWTFYRANLRSTQYSTDSVRIASSSDPNIDKHKCQTAGFWLYSVSSAHDAHGLWKEAARVPSQRCAAIRWQNASIGAGVP